MLNGKVNLRKISVKAKLLKHKKRNHIDSVPSCKNMINGTCNYGSENCWFNHSNFKNSNETESNENVNNENGNN